MQKADGKVVNYKGFQSWYTVDRKLMLSGRGVWRLRKMYASCKGGSNRRNERSLFNHVFIFGCYMTPFVSLGVGTLDVCLCFLHFKSFPFILVFVSFTLVWLVSVAPCRSPLLLHRFSIFFGYVISHNFIREYFF